jgi:hypothetical protein
MRLFQISITAITLLAGVIAPPSIAAEPQSIVGDWQGQLDTGSSKLLVALHVERAKDGKLEATLGGITKHQFDVEVESIRFSSPDLHFAIEGGNGVYDAKLSHDSSSLVGVWKQCDSAMPLVFHRVTDDFVENLTSRPMSRSRKDLDGRSCRHGAKYRAPTHADDGLRCFCNSRSSDGQKQSASSVGRFSTGESRERKTGRWK